MASQARHQLVAHQETTAARFGVPWGEGVPFGRLSTAVPFGEGVPRQHERAGSSRMRGGAPNLADVELNRSGLGEGDRRSRTA